MGRKRKKSKRVNFSKIKNKEMNNQFGKFGKPENFNNSNNSNKSNNSNGWSGNWNSNNKYGGTGGYYSNNYGYGSNHSYKKPSVAEALKGIVKVGEEVPDLGLLTQLVENQSPSRSEHLSCFIEWLIDYVHHNVPNAILDIDKVGNLYITKGSSEFYPCIVAHTDTNQDLHEEVTLFHVEDILFGWDKSNSKQVGPGFDDKVGILIAFQCLKKFDVLKVFLPIDEEVGYIGSGRADLSWFDDVSYCIQPDRNSYKTDFITHTNGVDVCSKEFTNACKPVMHKYNYSEASGIGTDIGELKSRGLECSAINVSCGYFKEHSDQEVCSVVALHNCLNFVTDLINHLGTQRFEHVVKSKYFDNWFESDRAKSIFDEDKAQEYEDIWGHYSEDFYDEFSGKEHKQTEKDNGFLSDYVWDSSNCLLIAEDFEALEAGYCPGCYELLGLDYDLETKEETYHCEHCTAEYWKINKNGNNNKGYKANKRR